MGKRKNSTKDDEQLPRQMSDEQKEICAERLRAMREK